MFDLDRLSKEMRVFSDPATPFSSEIVGDQIRIRMVRDIDREYLANISNGSIVARHLSGKRFSSIAALLASEEFIDIRKLRANQRRLIASRIEASGGFRPMLEPEGAFIGRDGHRSPLSHSSLAEALDVRSDEQLSVVLLDGPAGVGKTSLIERLAYDRSAPDSMRPPLLHVVSGGGRLTDLVKALAHSLQVVRSVITFDQVPILVRHGVLQVAIDGFDELVDPDGYRDAWSALRDFLGDVGSGGPIVLSGRDTFFDQQSFEKLLLDRIPNLAIRQARLSTVSPSAARDFLAGRGWSRSDLDEAQEAGWFRPGSYQLRPFFLAQIADQDGWKELQISHGSPQSFLVTRMVHREAEILSRTAKLQGGRMEAALWDFYGVVAEDMAIQQSDHVDDEFLAFACESAFADYVEPLELKKLVHKASSFALLEASGVSGARRFPHSEFQNQFAARAVIRVALSSSESSTFIRLAQIDAGFAEAFADVFCQLDPVEAGAIHANFQKMLNSEIYSERLSSNISALLIAGLVRPDLEELALSNVAVHEAKIVGIARNASLRCVNFGQLDLIDADCSSVFFVDCKLGVLSINSSSVFPARFPIPFLINKVVDGRVEIVRDPAEIMAVISAQSRSVEGSVSELPLVIYLDRLCRAFIRQHQIRDHDEDASFHLLKDPRWKVVSEVLGDRLVVQVRTAGGPKSNFYRLISPEGLLHPENDVDRALRKNIEEIAIITSGSSN